MYQSGDWDSAGHSKINYFFQTLVGNVDTVILVENPDRVALYLSATLSLAVNWKLGAPVVNFDGYQIPPSTVGIRLLRSEIGESITQALHMLVAGGNGSVQGFEVVLTGPREP